VVVEQIGQGTQRGAFEHRTPAKIEPSLVETCIPPCFFCGMEEEPG
jgi:hypothetical protein